MKIILAAVMWIGFASVITATPPIPQRHQQTNGQVQLASEFVREPNTVPQMRIGETYWVPAHVLVIDDDATCWINKHQKLDEKSLHMIQVRRFHDTGQTNSVLYGVRIERKKLQGWTWQLGENGGKYYESTGHLAVSSLDVSD